MPTRTIRAASAASLALLAAAAGAQPVTLNEIRFIDRGASGEINLGDLRGGIAVLDFDLDGWQDLIIADSPGRATRLFRNIDDPARPGRRNFADVTAGSGLDDADGTARSRFGVVAADIDNDGDPDVYMTGVHSASGAHGLLYRNEGGGRFTNISLSSGLRATGSTAESALWIDFDLDGLVDLFTANHGVSARGAGLWRNLGGGVFEDAAARLPGLPVPGHNYSCLSTDHDADGWPDIVMIQNSNPPALLRNVALPSGARGFVNTAALAGYTQLGPAPMGIAAGDFDLDGDLDWSITDAVSGTYYENLGGGRVRRIFPFATFFGWGTTWLDADNDTRLDQYQAGSYSASAVDQLVRNAGPGGWTNISAALNTTSLASQHSVQVDFNNDGRQDLITINPGTPGRFISVYENDSPAAGRWLKLVLDGDGPGLNRQAIGAVVRVTAGGVTQVREISSGSSLTATEDLRPAFGLGAASEVEMIEVVWPGPGSLAVRTDTYLGPFATNDILTLRPGCPADLKGDGLVDFIDFLVFLSYYDAGDPRVDFNGDGAVSFPDYLEFLNLFEQGC